MLGSGMQSVKSIDEEKGLGFTSFFFSFLFLLIGCITKETLLLLNNPSRLKKKKIKIREKTDTRALQL